ncbi:MAG: hypothetical protein ACE5IZ_08750 [Dehalococcoidia bacterium]
MKRFGLAFIVLLVAGLLALGALSALADKGGPGHGADHGVANGLQDGAGDGVIAQEDGEGEPEMVGAEAIAEAIADAFGAEFGALGIDGVDASTVMTQHQQGIGWGVLFQLYAIAQARGITIDALLQEIVFTEDGEHDFALGKMRNDLSDEEQEALDDVANNLGELVSEAHHEGAAVQAQGADQGNAFGRGHGTGQPPGVPAGEEE